MGLPGPIIFDRPNAAVLVASELFIFFEGFLDTAGLSTSLAHEIGHFMGLYHTSEKDGAAHDVLSDTPECSEAFACDAEFEKNLMTSAFWLSGPTTVRELFTEQQGEVIRRHPLCVPMTVEVPVGPPSCDEECDPPNTCAEINGIEDCKPACDPSNATPCPGGGQCNPDDLGTFVCS
jgi:hypothetical protein